MLGVNGNLSSPLSGNRGFAKTGRSVASYDISASFKSPERFKYRPLEKIDEEDISILETEKNSKDIGVIYKSFMLMKSVESMDTIPDDFDLKLTFTRKSNTKSN